jgi:hypothetical protein
VTYTYTSPPRITHVSPTKGPERGGSIVVIEGVSLEHVDAVRFGDVPAQSFTTVSPYEIRAISPPGLGSVQLAVSTADATDFGPSFRYVPSPSITAVEPGRGPSTGGTQVVIAGSGLTDVDEVRFDGVAAPASPLPDGSLQVNAPPHLPGDVALTLSSPGGTATSSFHYVGPPKIDALSPTTGSILGGTTVTITGEDFDGATSVRFGALAATAFTVIDPTHIRATSPLGLPGAVEVSVITPLGASAASAGSRFTYTVL